MLLAGTSSAQALLFRLSSSSGKEQLGPAQAYQHPSVPGSRRPNSSRISSVAINPVRETRLFLSTENENFHVWNIERPAEPLLSKKGTHSALTALEWTPDPNLFSLCDADGNVKILDTRVISDESDAIADGRSTAWVHLAASRDAATTLRWNLFAPTCFALGTEGGLVQVFDVRYGTQPLLSIASHIGGVSSLAFSPHNCDLIHTGGADSKWNLLSLAAAPHCLVASSPPLPAPVVHVYCPPSDTFKCFAVCRNGAIASCTLQESLVTQLAPSRFKPDQAEERAVESSLYRRDFSAAIDKVTSLAQKYAAQNCLERALPLLRLFHYEQSVKSLDDALTSLPSTQAGRSDRQAVQLFLGEMADLSYFIPPSYAAKVDSKKREKVMAVRWVADLISAVKTNSLKTVLDYLPEVISKLTANPRSLEMAIVLELMGFLVNYDYLRALDLGCRLAALFAATDLWPDFLPAVHLLLYPTIWDSLDEFRPPASPPSGFVQSALIQKKLLLPQLQLLQRLMEALSSRGDILPLLPDASSSPSSSSPFLSAAAYRIALFALLQSHHYERAFALVENGLVATTGLPFNVALIQFVLEFALPSFNQLAADVTSSAQLVALLVAIVVVACRYDHLLSAEAVAAAFRASLKRIVKVMEDRVRDLASPLKEEEARRMHEELRDAMDIEKVKDPFGKDLQRLDRFLKRTIEGKPERRPARRVKKKPDAGPAPAADPPKQR